MNMILNRQGAGVARSGHFPGIENLAFLASRRLILSEYLRPGKKMSAL
jgi:hypothetical protein